MSVRIKKLTVDGIGALHGFVLEPGSLTVVEGDNEAGKSSIVVALHRALRASFARTNAASLEGVRRNVPGYEGDVELELVRSDPSAPGQGEPVSAPPKKLGENPLLWNLLVIPEGRAAERVVGASRDWFQEAFDHLTGFDPDPLCRSIRSRGGLTPTDRDTRDWDERGTQIDDEIGKIESFLNSLASLPEQEAQLRAARSQLADLQQEARAERRAVDFARYQGARKALNTLETAEAALPNYERYTDEDLRAWRQVQSDRGQAKATLGQAQEGLEARESELSEARDDINQLKRERGEAAGIVDRITGSGISGRARDVTSRLEAAEEQVRQWRKFRPVGWILTALGATALLLGMIISRWDVALLGISIAVGVALLILEGRRSANARAARREAHQLLGDGREIGIATDDVQGLVQAVKEAHSRATNLETRLSTSRQEASRRENLLEEQRSKVKGFGKHLAKIDEQLSEIRACTGLGTIADLEAKVGERQERQRQKEQAETELTNLFGASDRARWEEKVAALEVPDPGRRPTQGRLEELEGQLENERNRVNDSKANTRGVLDRGLIKIGHSDLPSARQALESLRQEQRERELLRRSAHLALDAIESAQSDLEAQFDQALCDPDRGVNALFARITGGRWAGVRRRAQGELEAVLPDGSGVPLDALSRGTVDQLYFAIRAVLAERILGAPSFFVWDDTFLTADPSRRQILVDTAVELVRSGWQILYLTVDPSLTRMFDEAAKKAGIEKFKRVVLEMSSDRRGPPEVVVSTDAAKLTTE